MTPVNTAGHFRDQASVTTSGHGEGDWEGPLPGHRGIRFSSERTASGVSGGCANGFDELTVFNIKRVSRRISYRSVYIHSLFCIFLQFPNPSLRCPRVKKGRFYKLKTKADPEEPAKPLSGGHAERFSHASGRRHRNAPAVRGT